MFRSFRSFCLWLKAVEYRLLEADYSGSELFKRKRRETTTKILAVFVSMPDKGMMDPKCQEKSARIKSP